MTKTVSIKCDNCGRDLGDSEGWHLSLSSWFVPPPRHGNSMTLEHRVYHNPVSEELHFCAIECIVSYARHEWGLKS